MIAALLLAAQAPLPAPVEGGLQPPMTFSCQVAGEAGSVELAGTISRFHTKVPAGMGLMVIPRNGAYLDHIVLELAPSAIGELAGRHDVNARFPVDTDTMVVALPGDSPATGYTLTFSPVRFGTGYQAFSQVRVERSGGGQEGHAGACTTILPNLEKKP